MRLSTCLLAVAMAVPAFAWETVENSGITAEQRQMLEARTCRAWQAHAIESFRTEKIEGSGWTRLSFECESHGEFRGHPLRAVGFCEGIDADWKCEAAGQQIDLGAGEDPRPVRMVDVTPETTLEVIAFLESEVRKGRRIRGTALDGHITLIQRVAGAGYLATVNHGEYETALVIDSKCGARGCRYHLGKVESYQTFL